MNSQRCNKGEVYTNVSLVSIILMLIIKTMRTQGFGNDIFDSRILHLEVLIIHFFL
jgi:hypothetical protein